MSKKTKMYLVTYKTDALSLPTILQAMEGSAALVSVREAPAEPGDPPAKETRHVNRINGMDGTKLLKQVLSTQVGGRTVEQIKTAFVDMGYAGNTARARISEAVRDGTIVQAGGKFYVKQQQGV